DADASAAPEAMAAIRLRPSSAAPTPPAIVSAWAQRSLRAGRPVCRGSASTGCISAVSFSEKYSSEAAPSVPKTRAGRVSEGGVVNSAIPEDAIAADETNRYDMLSFPPFQVGTDVSASKAPV